ncbi:hypothetical protein GCM10027445_19120 [Amycolatopsis endophytica]|uniref:DUF4232 domain-containing protein n=1 Tax=Amycolatopsis endophytica TaxID=860233 RepID=A0A853BF38_9PSEU|nr:DUF4232 domain-containing protein [Amycolatopsis endophytica]NYI93197.1 hypothetical protein [Amycolatopsis endophytica]
MTNRITRTGAAVAVAAVTAGAFAFAGGTAQAEPTDLGCTATQVDTTLIQGPGAAGTHGGYLQFTAKPGEACYLGGSVPVNLVGADNVLVTNDAPADAPMIYLRSGGSAYVQLTWTAIAPPEQQQTPLAVSVDTPGHPEGPFMTTDWTLGSVDATPESHEIHVGPATPGAAPTM